jgi:hypothetical protein
MANGWGLGQQLKPRPAADQGAKEEKQEFTVRPLSAEASAVTVEIRVPSGTSIKVALDSEVRIREVGQPIHGKTTEPVYVFDKLLIPVGTGVNGMVSAIDAVSRRTRTLEAMDGNFSPVRAVHVRFDEMVMGDGHRISMQTEASPAPNGVLSFVPANAQTEKNNKAENAAARKVSATRHEIQRQ